MPQAATVAPEQIPLQVRLPRDEVRTIKIAAAERDQTISDLMIAFFHAYMKSGKACRMKLEIRLPHG
jgi:hypothetical protein